MKVEPSRLHLPEDQVWEIKKVDFAVVAEFEKKIAEFFGAPYAVSVDSATHGMELCLRLLKAKEILVPRNTYLSVPMLADKLGIRLRWHYEGWNWQDRYMIASCFDKLTGAWYDVYDAAVLWRKDSYVPNSMMSVSFQYQKHLGLGRGGIILLDNILHWQLLKKMSYDGRLPNIPWRDQNVDSIGYHYYLQPETAALGLEKLPGAIVTEPRKWKLEDWPDLTKMDVFKNTVE